jgi:hypothetical protein
MAGQAQRLTTFDALAKCRALPGRHFSLDWNCVEVVGGGGVGGGGPKATVDAIVAECAKVVRRSFFACSNLISRKKTII